MSRTAMIRVQRETDSALADLRGRFLAAWHDGGYQGEVFVFACVPFAEIRADFALRGAA